MLQAVRAKVNNWVDSWVQPMLESDIQQRTQRLAEWVSHGNGDITGACETLTQLLKDAVHAWPDPPAEGTSGHALLQDLQRSACGAVRRIGAILREDDEAGLPEKFPLAFEKLGLVLVNFAHFEQTLLPVYRDVREDVISLQEGSIMKGETPYATKLDKIIPHRNSGLKRVKRLEFKSGDHAFYMVATNTLDYGANGKFRLGMITPGELVAIKEFRLPMPGHSGASGKKTGCSHPLSIEREVRRLQEIRSPIAPIGQVRFSGSAGYKQMLLMPLMLGDAWRATQSIKALEDSQQQPARRRLARGLLLHVAEALESLHASGFVHGDLKPWNVLAAEDGRMVLSDLGAAKPVGLCARSLCTYNFRPPEDVDGVRPLRLLPSFDIYGLGLTYLAVLMPEQHDARTLPKRERLNPHPDASRQDPELAGFVLNNMLHNDPSQRPSAKEVVAFVRGLEGSDTLQQDCAKDLKASMQGVMEKRGRIQAALGRALEDAFDRRVATPSPDPVAPRVISR